MTAIEQARSLYERLFAPGQDHVHDVAGLAADPRSGTIVIAGRTFAGGLDQGVSTALHRVAADGRVRLISSTRDARSPAFSPTGAQLAWASPENAGSILVVAEGGGAGSRRSVRIPGLIEQIAWSHDEAAILLVVAGPGADTGGVEGGVTMAGGGDRAPGEPIILTPRLESAWRRAWRVDAASLRAEPLSPTGRNVWEAVWAGENVLAVASAHYGEAAWYRSSLTLIKPDGSCENLYRPADQIGCPAAIAGESSGFFIEAFCSDRGLVCGALKRIDLSSGAISAIDTGPFEIASVRAGDEGVVVAGMRGRETIAGTVSRDGRFTVHWRSETETCGAWLPEAWPWREGVLVVAEEWNRSPRLQAVTSGSTVTIRDFAPPGEPLAIGGAEWVHWSAPDGLEIEGLLVGPEEAWPLPLVLDIHGGPVWASRRRWMGRGRAAPLLVERGCRVLFPNPRGSSGYGQAFARRVEGDLGGLEVEDHLSGLEALVSRGLADPARIACTGSSHGGFMSCWLATRFAALAAAAPISPVTNWISQHGTSQIPFFDEAFLKSAARDPAGRHLSRSPVMYADKVRAPTLLLAGGRDRNTPPTQALEFYTALVESGVETALLTYSEEGHSVRGQPAYVDSAGRITAWFERFLNLEVAPSP